VMDLGTILYLESYLKVIEQLFFLFLALT